MRSLYCGSNQLTNLDVSGCTQLRSLYCGSNQLTNLDVSGCTQLRSLYCGSNQLTNLDVSGCTQLRSLYCGSNQLTNLDVSGCTQLRSLYCGSNQLTNLDVSGCTQLRSLYCGSNQLTNLDVSGCTELYSLNCPDNQLTSLNASNCVSLTKLDCSDCRQLSVLNLSGCTALNQLDCSKKQLTSLDLSGCTALKKLDCSNNRLTSLNLSDCISLLKLDCSGNNLTSLDASDNTLLQKLNCSRNQLASLYIFNNTKLEELYSFQNQLTALYVPQSSVLMHIECFGNQIKGDEMTRLMNSLPNRTGQKTGELIVFQEPLPEGNRCLKSDVFIAMGKNWKTLKINLDKDPWETDNYEGFVPTYYKVTLTTEGEGTLKTIGAIDLNAVAYGTVLTIEATPAEGYYLAALTANGADILETKKIVITGATIVNATFIKKSTSIVTLTKEGEGTLNATGAADLNAVPEGTELTIEATPAEGYELKTLTANGTDILATKKFTVTADTEVKAIFTKKTFTVTLTKEGEGLLNATGADDLSAVPLDTELTIVATPAEGYELKALTANGTDILATKKFVVKGATEIKATFTKKTAADRVEAGSVHLYPNPASTYVNVKAAKADALVRLYDANGTLLYEARTDDHGMLQIELSAYAEGTYLLRVDSNAQRLLIQR